MCARGKALKERSDFLIKQLRRFLELYETEWKLHSNNAKAFYDESKLNTPEKLASEEDIKLLRGYCIQEINGLCNKYSTGSFTAADYRQLARLCLARGVNVYCSDRRGNTKVDSTTAGWCRRWSLEEEFRDSKFN